MSSAESASTGRRWRGRESEDRQADRRAALLAAGFDLLGTQGAHRVTVRGVCRQAQLTERYFYESFVGRTELLVAVLEQVVGEARDVLRAVALAHPEGGEALVRASAASVTDFVLADPRRGRVLFVEPAADADLGRRMAELGEDTAAVIGQVIREGGLARPGSDDAEVRLDAIAVLGAVSFLFQALLAGRIERERAAFVEYLTAVLQRIVGPAHAHPVTTGSRRAPGAASGTTGRRGATAGTRS